MLYAFVALLVAGTCLHRGCTPSKALLHAALIMEAIEDGTRRWGIDAAVKGIDAAVLAATRDDIVTRNFKGLLQHLRQQLVAFFEGHGTVASPRTGSVAPIAGRPDRPVLRLTARRGLVIATGSAPGQLRGLRADGTPVLTSDDATRSDRIPRSVIVVGAGAIGVEFATAICCSRNTCLAGNPPPGRASSGGSVPLHQQGSLDRPDSQRLRYDIREIVG